MTTVFVPKEIANDETRVAATPDSVKRLLKTGAKVRVESGAGVKAHFPDRDYQTAGAEIVSSADAKSAWGAADVVVKVQRPNDEEARALKAGSLLISYLQPAQNQALISQFAQQKVNAIAMEKVPRTTRGQAVDALSSQATVAGYKAVLLGASASGQLLPMLTTAAGTLKPSKVLILGAGVAGLQAIATARRLGAVVHAFDVRPVVREQVQSLGAKFVEIEGVGKNAEGAGGYAKEVAADEQTRILEAIGKVLPEMDLVISTAQIPNKPAPRLITSAMIAKMKPGAVIVDLAAETGGNCELTRAGQTVTDHEVTILGPVNVPATVPTHASAMYARNVLTLLELAIKDGQLNLDLNDEIFSSMLVTHDGQVRS